MRTHKKTHRLDLEMEFITGMFDSEHHLPRRGDRPPLSLPISSSSSIPSKQRPLLLILTSELALLLVARGESETLTVLLLAGPDLTLYIEDAGILVIKGRKLPGMVRLMSCSIQNKIRINNRIKHWIA
jgi:hypothetical protein